MLQSKINPVTDWRFSGDRTESNYMYGTDNPGGLQRNPNRVRMLKKTRIRELFRKGKKQIVYNEKHGLYLLQDESEN